MGVPLRQARQTVYAFVENLPKEKGGVCFCNGVEPLVAPFVKFKNGVEPLTLNPYIPSYLTLLLVNP